MPEHWATPRFLGGLGLVGLAGLLLLAGNGTIAAPITLLVVGLVLIAGSRSKQDS